jgi:hypothetical protein
MEKTVKTAESSKKSDDIAQQPYRGPSVTAAAAGEGFIAHFQWAGIGLVAGGLAAWLLHGRVGPWISDLRSWANKHAGTATTPQNENFGVRWPAKLVRGIFGHGPEFKLPEHKIQEITDEQRNGFGVFMLNHLLGLIPGAKAKFNEFRVNNPAGADRLNLAVTAGGLFAFMGYAVLPVFLGGKGYAKGKEGKRQFERAKEEILDLRAENAKLRSEKAQLRGKMFDDGTPDTKLVVSQDQQPAIAASASAPVVTSVDKEDPAGAKIEQRDAVAVDQQVQRESPIKIDPPKIEPPKQWWDGILQAQAPAPEQSAAAKPQKEWGERMQERRSEAATAQDTALA